MLKSQANLKYFGIKKLRSEMGVGRKKIFLEKDKSQLK